MSELQDWLDSWPLPEGEPFKGETLRADGWVYRDIGWMTLPWWNKLWDEIVGPENVRVLVMSSRMIKGDDCRRGQIFISPEGLKKATDWLNRERSHS